MTTLFTRSPGAQAGCRQETRTQWRIRRAADKAERRPEGTARGFQPARNTDNLADRDPQVAQAVLEAKDGSQDAVRFLYMRYANNVYGYALSLVRNPDEAEDVTQQVFLKLMSNLARYEPRNVPFAAWIIRMTRNVSIDKLRERREVPCSEVYGPGASDEPGERVRSDELRAALVQLPEDQRRVVVLRHVLGLSPGEIGACLDKTQASVHGLHNRGRQALKHELRRIGAVPTAA